MPEQENAPDPGEVRGFEPGGSGEELRGWRRLALFLVAPLLLLAPSLLPGRRFLPLLPTYYPPLSAESPEAAELAAEGANFSTTDRILPFLTDQLEMRRQLSGGTLPTWDPNVGMGMPLFGGSLVAPAYPPNWLAFLAPPDLAAGWLAMLCLLVGSSGVWFFLRRRGLSPGATAVGVVAFQTAGWALANLHLPMKVDAAVWLPWCLWAVEGIAAKQRGAGFFLFLFTAFSFLAGFVPIAIFCALVVALFGVWRLFIDHRIQAIAVPPMRGVVQVAVFLGLGMLGSSVQLLTNAEASEQSIRVPKTAEVLANEALPLGAALSLIAPDLFGGPESFNPRPHPISVWLSSSDERHQVESLASLEWNAFAGVAALALALVALIATPRRALFPTLLLLAAWGFAQGWPVMRFFYHLPGFDLGSPARALSVQWFLWPWLAAIGAQAIVDRKPRALSSLLVIAFTLTAGAFLFWTGFDPATWASTLVDVVAERFDAPREYVIEQLSEATRLEAGQALLACSVRVLGAGAALFAAGLCALLLGRSPAAFGEGTPPWKLYFALGVVLALFLITQATSNPERIFFPLALGLLYFLVAGRARDAVAMAGWLPFVLIIGLEGFGNGAPHLQPRKLAGEVFPESPAIEAIRSAAGDGRVLRFDRGLAADPVDVEALARPNLLEAYGIHELTPYTVFTPRSLVELVTALDPKAAYRSGISSFTEVEHVGHPIMDLLRVKAVLATVPLEHPRLKKTFELPGFYVYERSGVPPVAHVVREALETDTDEDALRILAAPDFDPLRQVVLSPGVSAGEEPDASRGANETSQAVRVSASRLDVAIESTGGGWIVFHEQYFPGWKGVLDGEDVEIVRVNHAQRAIRIPAGEHLVRTKYEPWSLRFGTLGTLLALLLAWWLSFKKFDPKVSSAS